MIDYDYIVLGGGIIGCSIVSIRHTSAIAVSCLAKSCDVALIGLDLEN